MTSSQRAFTIDDELWNTVRDFLEKNHDAILDTNTKVVVKAFEFIRAKEEL